MVTLPEDVRRIARMVPQLCAHAAAGVLDDLAELDAPSDVRAQFVEGVGRVVAPLGAAVEDPGRSVEVLVEILTSLGPDGAERAAKLLDQLRREPDPWRPFRPAVDGGAPRFIDQLARALWA